MERVVVGADGFAMLALSCAVIAATGGVSLLAVFVHVVRVAAGTPAEGGQGDIIVLGKQLGADGRPNDVFRARLDRAAALASGNGCATEAAAGRAYLVASGVPAWRVEVEDRSRHTLENLRLYRAAYAGRVAGTAALVTSRFHLARAAAMADGLGIAQRPCAAEAGLSPSPAMLRALLTEAFLLHWYWAGATFSRWTRNERMLARIT